MSEQVAAIVTEFLFKTIVGHERGLYRALRMQGKDLSNLRDKTAFLYFAGTTASYFNGAYKSLILRDDVYIMEWFDRMHNVSQHSYICLLNIVCKMCLDIHGAVDRSALDVSSLEAYQHSVETALKPLLVDAYTNLATRLNHQCAGMDIRTCDPNTPMFHIGDATVVLQDKDGNEKTVNVKMGEDNVERKCAVCSLPTTSRCGGCSAIYYCSVAHQSSDWREHKLVCEKKIKQ